MIKNCFTQQLKQKVLQYQIKTIQNCTDSLFTQSSCGHQRYLCWQLGETLKHILDHYAYKYRWIGNQSSAYIYAYFYVVVIGCASDSSNMLELKLILYDLGQKYLAQYQQKLLIQFLCLIEYSTDRYLFFRKYSKIQTILLKIFKEIQNRNLAQVDQTNRDSCEQMNAFSKLTTCVTSPSQNKGHQDNFTKLMRNSDYYNSSMKRVQRQYQKYMSRKSKKSSYPTKQKHIQKYQMFNKIFYFVKMKIQAQKHVRIIMDFNKNANSQQQFIIAVQKGCFFVVQLKSIEGDFDFLKQKSKDKKNSVVEQSQMYLNQLLQNEIQKSKILAEMNEHYKKKKSSKTDSLNYTPKFISDRKNIAVEHKDLYKQDHINKNINIQVLQISPFQQHRPPLNSQRSIDQSVNPDVKSIHYTKKIDNLDNIGDVFKTVESGKNSLIQNIRSHPELPGKWNKNIKNIKTEQSINNNPSFIKKNEKEHLKHNRNPQSKYSISNKINRNADCRQPLANCNKDKDGIITVPSPQNTSQIKKINHTKMTQVSSNQTVLSAAILRKSLKCMNQNRKNVMILNKLDKKGRPFHSNSPPIAVHNNTFQFYSPSKILPQMNKKTQFLGKPKINFTYL